MGLFSARRKSSARAGLYADAAGTAIARVAAQRGRKPALLASAFMPGDELPDGDGLDALARRLGAGGEAVNVVLAAPDYQLLMVEAPDVDPEELRSAIRWRVKDLIDFHIDDAVFDVFAVPGQQNRPRGQAQMYAVAARASRVGTLVDRIDPTCLKLEVIDITELAMRNLAALADADARGIVLLRLDRHGGVLTITRQHELYVTRRLEFGAAELVDQGATFHDQVLLEIQRSIDYYGSHFAQPSPAALALLPGFETAGELAEWLDGELDVGVEVFDVARYMECRIRPDEAGIGDQLLAIGGALRREEMSL